MDGGEVFYALNAVRVDVVVETFGVLNKCCGQCPGYDKFLSFLRSVSGRDAPNRSCCDLFRFHRTFLLSSILSFHSRPQPEVQSMVAYV